MASFRLSRTQMILLAGDAITLSLVTLVGFVSHNTLESAAGRYWATYLPWLAAWLLVAPHLGVFVEQLAVRPNQLWRPVWAMLLASPLGAFLRGLWLGRDITPSFVLVFAAVSAVAILLWRALYWVLWGRKRANNG